MSGPVTCTPRISSGSVERNGLAGSAERTGCEDDARGPGRAGEEPRQAEERGAAEQDEHGHRDEAAPADLAPAELALVTATLAVVDVRGDCHEGPGW